jgi:hypothetical protein
MTMQTATYPRVSAVEPLVEKRLLVTFSNGVKKVYDCRPLLREDGFAVLRDEAVFRCVSADPHGYGVLWDDETDLAESELWLNGVAIERSPATGS